MHDAPAHKVHQSTPDKIPPDNMPPLDLLLTCTTNRCHSAAIARALPNTRACSASLHSKLPGGADRGSMSSPLPPAAAAAAAAVDGSCKDSRPPPPSAPAPAAAPADVGVSRGDTAGPTPELALLSESGAGVPAPKSLLALLLAASPPLLPPLPAAAAAVAAVGGLGGLSRSRSTLSNTLSGGRGGAEGSPRDSHHSAPVVLEGTWNSDSKCNSGCFQGQQVLFASSLLASTKAR